MIKIITVLCSAIGFTIISLICIAGLIVALASPKLPQVSELVDYTPKLPLRIMTADGILIGEFGEEKRKVVEYKNTPKVLIDAILAAEDDKFFEHRGIDLTGMARSVINNVLKGAKAQGGSTITMQVARNFYLSSEKTFTRKIYEILLAMEIERNLTKEQILELYLNKIYLGKRAYGFGSAAFVYFGKRLDEINIAEAAMLAGLPKAPSKFNPYSNYRRSIIRQRYVLNRMYKLGKITLSEYQKNYELKLVLNKGKEKGNQIKLSVPANHVAEMVRQKLFSEFKEKTYELGLTVFTTIRSKEQIAAKAAVDKAVTNYTAKSNFEGPDGFIKISEKKIPLDQEIENYLEKQAKIGSFYPGVVKKIKSSTLQITVKDIGEINIKINEEVRGYINQTLASSEKSKLRVGSLVWVIKRTDGKNKYKITNKPKVEGAIVAIQTNNGAIKALVGGYDFYSNKYNRAIQAYRQPGSAIKPFIFGAALEKGISTSTIVNDLPVNFDAESTGGVLWEPSNFNDVYLGPISIKEALTKSQNMVSIRLIKRIDPSFAQGYIRRFGFESSKNPPYFTLALGAGAVTPLQLAVGYSIIANGGFYIKPYFIDRIVDSEGRLVRKYEPIKTGDENLRVIDARHAFIINNILSEVIKTGTGKKARSLGRPDLAGKTGTTNDAFDAWFAGYQPTLAAITWFGFDSPKSLGKNQTGSAVALPIWIDFMKHALKNVPITFPIEPQGIIRINDDLFTEDTTPPSGILSIDVKTLDDKIDPT